MMEPGVQLDEEMACTYRKKCGKPLSTQLGRFRLAGQGRHPFACLQTKPPALYRAKMSIFMIDENGESDTLPGGGISRFFIK